MTSNPDIIGIVKELQRLYSIAHNGGHPLTRPEQAIQADYEYHEKLMDSFPAIAQALLIAFRVLKNHEHLVRADHMENCDMCIALKEIGDLSPSQQ